MQRKVTFDHNNPEWTKKDFQEARPAHEVLSADVLAAFPRTRGPQKNQTKVPVSIRLSPEVIEHFKAGGAGWQSRIDDALRKIVQP